MPDFDGRTVAREFLRALRGRRSQVSVSRRLGYSSNVFAEWESGRRIPTALTALRTCARLGVNVELAFERFGSIAASRVGPKDRASVAEWLSSLKANRSLVQVANTASLSRHQVSRFLSGKSEPRLHEFFVLIDACTGRLPDFVSRLVDIHSVPTLALEYERVATSRSLSFEQPWVAAILAALDCLPTLRRERASAILSESLALSESQVASCLAALEFAKVIEWTADGVRLSGPLLIDTGANPDGARQLRHHWSVVAANRAARPHSNDLFSYNVFSVSRADLQKLRRLQSEYYQRVRDLIADSPPETAALLNLQLIEWDVSASRDQ